MRNRLQRIYGRGHLHFVTFSCYQRRPLLGTARARHRFVKVLDQVRTKHRFLLIGYVVMPEHVHLLFSEPKRGNPSKTLQVLKQQVSRSLRKRKRETTAQMTLAFAGETSSPAFWQRRFYDFNVWSRKKLREKLDYMHRNPVQRKLVLHPKDWPWSSWSHYEKGRSGVDPHRCRWSRRRRNRGPREIQRPHP
jgi:putative transposase